MRSFEVLTHFLSVPRAANYASAIQHSYWSRHTNTVYQLKWPIFKRLYTKRKVQPKTCERRGTNLGLLSFILNHSLCPQLASAKYIDTWIKFIIIIIIITNSTAGGWIYEPMALEIAEEMNRFCRLCSTKQESAIFEHQSRKSLHGICYYTWENRCFG